MSSVALLFISAPGLAGAKRFTFSGMPRCKLPHSGQQATGRRDKRQLNIAGSAQTKEGLHFQVLPFLVLRLLPEPGQAKIERPDSICRGDTRRRVPLAMTFITLVLGLCAGVLVGLLGIGGGVVLVPAMVYLLHMDQHLAQGTSLFILLPPIGLGALREYWKQGQVALHAGILCALGMLFGAYTGSLIAVPLPSRHLKGLFGCFLILSGFLLWRKAQLEARAVASGGEDIARA